MTEKNKISDISRWIALACLVVPMFASYFFDDMFSSVSQLFRNPELLELGWDSADYGFYAGGYSFLCVWGGLIICGMLLDKWGVRLTGSIFVGLMTAGAATVTVAITSGLSPETSLIVAYAGCMMFGLGSEIAGVAVTRSIAKWFKGKSMALAMGLQVATARFGTAAALFFSLPIAQRWGGVPSSIALGCVLLCIALVAYIVYCIMDKKLDESIRICAANDSKGAAEQEDEQFHLSDLGAIFSNPGFWIICLLCLMFYGGVFPFLKFATKLMIDKYGVSAEWAGSIPGMLPFGTIILTPVFGGIYDRKGHGVVLMILGSVLLTLVHILFAIPMLDGWWMAIACMILLGIAFSLVPSAMWPSVPKIIPMKQLGSAFAIIFFIQNIGLSLIPMGIGRVNQMNTSADGVTDYTHTMLIFAFFGLISILLALELLHLDKKKHYGLEEKNCK